MCPFPDRHIVKAVLSFQAKTSFRLSASCTDAFVRIKASIRRSSLPSPGLFPTPPPCAAGTPTAYSCFSLPPRHSRSWIIQVTSLSCDLFLSENATIRIFLNTEKAKIPYRTVKIFSRSNFLLYFLVTGFKLISVTVSNGHWSFLPWRIAQHCWN